MSTTPLLRSIAILGQYFLSGDDLEAARAIVPGNEVAIEHETTNEHDQFAALVRGPTGHKLGYIPKEMSPAICAFCDAGYKVTGTIIGFSAKNPIANIVVHDLA